MWNVIAPMVAGFAVDKMMGGNGVQGAIGGATMGYGSGATAAGGAAGGKGAVAGNAGANSVMAGNAFGSGGFGNLLGQGGSNALGLESAIKSTVDSAGMIPIDYSNTAGPGIDILSNYDAGLPLDSGFNSYLTEVGGNTGYQYGEPFLNPQEAFLQDKNLITDDMFKPATLDTMGISIDDNGVVQHNPTDMELFQPKETNRELTMQDYAERGVDKFGKMISKAGDYAYDYAYNNPDKLLLGGLQVASLLDNNTKKEVMQNLPAGFKQANVSGLNVPNQNLQYVVRPRKQRNYKIG